MRRFTFRLVCDNEATVISVDVFDNENGPFCYAEEALAELDKLRAENESLKNSYLRAVDEALVCAHLGTADPTDSYETAKGKLNQLICYEAGVREYFEAEVKSP